jgi:hypothetical protein
MKNQTNLKNPENPNFEHDAMKQKRVWEEAFGERALKLIRWDMELMEIAIRYWQGQILIDDLDRALEQGRINECELRAILQGENPLTWDCKKCREYDLILCEDIDCGQVACEDCVRLRLCVAEGKEGLIKYLKTRNQEIEEYTVDSNTLPLQFREVK